MDPLRKGSQGTSLVISCLYTLTLSIYYPDWLYCVMHRVHGMK